MAGHDRMRAHEQTVRASSEERGAVVDRLGAHFAAGRLTADELTERLDRAHAARTRADLAELERDLPALRPASAPARRRPRHARLAPPAPLLVLVVVALTAAVVAAGGFPWPLFLLFAAVPGGACGVRRRPGPQAGRA